MLIISCVLAAVFVALCLIGVVSILWVIFFSVRMMFQFSDSNVAFSKRTLWNPMNAIINPGTLSPEGLVSRKRVLRGSIAFVVSLALVGCIAAVFQLLDKT